MTDLSWTTDPTNDNNNQNNDLTQGLLSGSHTTEHQTNNNNPFAAAASDEEQQVILDGELNAASMGVVQGGEKQPNHFRDAWAAILFLAHHVAIFYLAFAWGVPSLSYSYSYSSYGDDSSSSNNGTVVVLQEGGQEQRKLDYEGDIGDNGSSSSSSSSIGGGLFFLTLTATLGALVISALALRFMISFAEFLIQFCLLFSVFCNALFVLFMILQGPYWTGAAVGTLCLLLSACYAKIVWRRVPFAAANLKTAITAVRLNGGIMFVALGWTIGMAVWSVVWLLALVGVYMRPAMTGECSATDEACLENSDYSGLIGIALLLSYYWTSEVTKNVVHVTTAGVVGTWWFAPHDADRFCSPAITDSLIRSTTWSLGSICFGSLLTAIVQVLHRLAREARRNSRNNAMVLCVVDCLLNFLERLVSYFNQYAFCYVGLYGYDYLSAGKKVFELFTERGWTTIINDQLVRRALLLVSIVMGAMTGCVGMLLATIKPDWMAGFDSGMDDDDGTSTSVLAIAFVIPFLMGTATAVILTSVVSSAVDTVIVAFAEAPLEFERNHPGLFAHMVTCWRQVYPDEFGM